MTRAARTDERDAEAADDEISVATAAATDAAAADAQALSVADAGAAQPADAGRAAGVVSFVGDFRGKDTNVMRVGGEPPSPPVDDPNARVTVSQNQAKLAFALYGEGGKVACTLHATQSGNAAHFSAGEKCFDEGSISSSVTRGSARIDGDTLTLELVFEMTIDAGGNVARGSLEYTFTGNRKK